MFATKAMLVAVALSILECTTRVMADNNAWKKLDASLVENQKIIEEIHNMLRRSVTPRAENMLKMEYNTDVAKNSIKWAEKCLFQHSTDADRIWVNDNIKWNCGENIFLSGNPRPWDSVVFSWYSEVISPGFEYGKGAKHPGAVGHFTQLVWYKSHQVGCAINYCPNIPGDLKYLYVCQYCPAGNDNARLNYPYDLGKPCEACPDSCVNNLCTNPCLYKDKYSNCEVMADRYGCGNDAAGKTIKLMCPAQCFCPKQVI
ncbi:serotriflin-like [Lethenteron reissneri]|uniref:serotriflin-like n=1 Tax=Lethenteron reissneri TaxID=7753 RepID=UPI002AB77405|nr:serotriflin-like [Lethenteron reissneri]